MRSVYKIRKFYKEHNLKEELNSRVMRIHVVAFADCVLSTSLLRSTSGFGVFFVLSYIQVAMLAVTQALLCAIFW